MPARLPFCAAALVFLTAVSTRAQAPLLTLTSPNPQVYGRFGWSVSGVPDADGDGRGDLLVGAASTEGYGENRTYLYGGATGVLLHTFTSPNAENGAFGYTVSGVADADGDGRGDVLVGAYAEYVGDLRWAGRAYLFSGASGSLLHTLTSPAPVSHGAFGLSVAGVTDVDGDGRGDLLVGATGEDPGASPDDAGRAYVFSGATGELLRTLESPNEEEDGSLGNAVAGIPDADGDGVGDLLVGAYAEDESDEGGRVYLFSGATGALLHALTNPFPGGYFGWSVAGLPDANGDGRGDLLVGTFEAGRVYLFSGATGARLRTIGCPISQCERFGQAISGVSDVDGDGRGDFVVGSSKYKRAYLHSGATGELLRTVLSPNPQDFLGSFGRSVAGVADADGDGRGDLLIGAASEDGGANNAGRAYLFPGSEISTAPALAITLTPTDPLPPVVIQQGDRAHFTATFDVAPYGPSEVEVWTDATRPDGTVTGTLLGPLTVLLTPGTSVTLPFEQGVGASSILGGYTYAMYAGTHPLVFIASDTEPATVVAAGAGSEAGEEWRAYDGSGLPLEAGAVLDLRQPAPSPVAGSPAAFALSGPTPNPAAGRATLRLDLSEGGRVRVALYDLLGREVALLADGAMEAGAHEITLDAGALAPGLYVARAVAGAHAAAVRLAVAR